MLSGDLESISNWFFLFFFLNSKISENIFCDFLTPAQDTRAVVDTLKYLSIMAVTTTILGVISLLCVCALGNGELPLPRMC